MTVREFVGLVRIERLMYSRIIFVVLTRCHASALVTRFSRTEAFYSRCSDVTDLGLGCIDVGVHTGSQELRDALGYS